jgi:hypothetical protein
MPSKSEPVLANVYLSDEIIGCIGDIIAVHVCLRWPDGRVIESDDCYAFKRAPYSLGVLLPSHNPSDPPCEIEVCLR